MATANSHSEAHHAHADAIPTPTSVGVRGVAKLLSPIVLALGFLAATPGAASALESATLGTLGLGSPAPGSPRVAGDVVKAADLSCRPGVRNAHPDSDQYGSYVLMSAQTVCSPKADVIVIYIHGYRDGHLVENPPPVTCKRTTVCTAAVGFDNPAGTQNFVTQFNTVASIAGPPTQQSQINVAVQYRG